MDAPIPLGNWQNSIDNILEDVGQNGDAFEKFSKLRSNKDRVNFVVDRKLLRSVDWLPIYFDGCDKGHDKSESVAEVWKNKGNKLFQQRKYREALDAYTQACLAAPSDKGNILALSFGNRSAALFHLAHYENCLVDIERALGQGFPLASKHKVLLRKTNALCKLGQRVKANDTLEALKQFLESKDCKLKGDQRDVFIKDCESQQSKIDSLSEACDKSSHVQREEKDRLDTLFGGVNDVLWQATKAVTLSYSPTKGRHLVANEDIPAGSPIIIEVPFSVVLLPDHYESHCHHCLARLPLTSIGHLLVFFSGNDLVVLKHWLGVLTTRETVRFIRCVDCSNVQYCNEVCRDAAWSSFHKIECPYLYLLHSIGIAHLSLRTILLAGTDFLIDFLAYENNHGDGIKGVNSNGVYDGSYLPVYHLMTHEETTAPQDMLQYSLTAALLLSVLIHSGYLDDRLKDDSSSSPASKQRKALLKDLFYRPSNKSAKTKDLPSGLLDIGGVLLRHILQLVCNAHAITSLESSTSSSPSSQSSSTHGAGEVEDFEQVRIATAIYPTASLMNHSCDPTIVSSFRKDVLTVKTIKNVKKGEEIYNCYGPHSRRMSRADRQEVLQSQYHFICQCQACGSQPVAHLRFGAFKCHQCAGVLSDDCCTECGVSISPEELRDKTKIERELRQRFDNGVLALREKKFETALSHFEKCQTGRKRLLYKDHRDLALCEDSIARCYASLGDYSTSADHLYKSVKFSKLIYGDQSVEHGHELQKLSEVLFTAERLSECLEVSQKAYAILRDSYGSGHESLRQLEGLIMTTTIGLNPLPSQKKKT